MGKVLAICASPQRGTEKTPQNTGRFLVDFGLEGDGHGGNWHRQVSLLSAQEIHNFQAKGAPISYGAFGENLVVEGIDFRRLPVGTQLNCGNVTLELSQIGKECHNHCQIYHKMGDCIMPREGVFAQVLSSGEISVGDEMTVLPRNSRPLRCAIITLSDRSFQGKREDESGKVLEKLLLEENFQVISKIILPDQQEELEKQLIHLADQRQVDLILTTGGTGFAPRDITPEATLAVAHRHAPGIAEAIRQESRQITPRAMLSRGVSVIRGATLIINLPGSPKACRECFAVFASQLPHAMELLRDIPLDCAR